jgi:hypothetical protein
MTNTANPANVERWPVTNQAAGTTTIQWYQGYTCGACGSWVTAGTYHVCNWYQPYTTGGTWNLPTCEHCLCITLKKDQYTKVDTPNAYADERTKAHKKCCRCGQVRVP